MYKEYFIYTATKALTAGNGTVFEAIQIKMDADADFEFHKTTYVATSANIKVKYRDESQDRYLQKRPVDIKTIAGRNNLSLDGSNSFIPYIWPRPYVVSGGANFIVEASDYSGLSNTLRIAFHGAKIRPGVSPIERRYRAAVPVVYPLSTGPITVDANSTVHTTVEIDIDSHFLVQKITGIRTGEALVTITESSRGRDWSNAPVHIDNLVGNGSFPNILIANRFIYRGSVLSVAIQDISGAPNTIEINFIGVKLYE